VAGEPPTSRVTWPQTHRLIMSHYPPIDLYDDIADPQDWDLITAAVQRTNPRVAESYGALDTIPPERRITGKGESWVMPAFVHFSPDRPSRFSDGTYGVYYAGDSLETALREHTFHLARFYADTNEPEGWPSEVRELIGSIDTDLVDLRGEDGEPYLDPNPGNYAPAQALAAGLRDADANGIVYPSLRNAGGTNIAVFWPNVIPAAHQADHYRYHWNGSEINFVRRITGDRAIYDLSAENDG
jgi:hypothetical protein